MWVIVWAVAWAPGWLSAESVESKLGFLPSGVCHIPSALAWLAAGSSSSARIARVVLAVPAVLSLSAKAAT